MRASCIVEPLTKAPGNAMGRNLQMGQREKSKRSSLLRWLQWASREELAKKKALPNDAGGDRDKS